MAPQKKNELVGGALRPAAGIWQDFGDAITKEIELFARDIAREMKAAFAGDHPGMAMDASVTAAAKRRINALREKWYKRFNHLSRTAVDRMMARTIRNSTVTLNMSLREIAEHISINTAFSDQRLKDVIAASTQQAAQLIKLIPGKYLDEVQGQVMRSITSGQGMKDLVPFLAEKYKGNVKWARHVAMDQTRKAYSTINSTRLQQMGIEEYVWIHTGGGRYPREEHIAMSGNTYRYDDPPVIDKRTGERGNPGQAVFCFPEWSGVETTNGIHKLFRRRFTGELSKIVTESGEAIEATPNHPILTLDGWKSIQSIDVGDYVIKAGGKGLDGLETDIQGRAATIRQLFDAAASCIGGGASFAGGSTFEFHGDMSDSEIDVIDIDAFLSDKADAAFCQKTVEFMLAWANKCRVDAGLHGDGSPDQTLMRAFGAPEGLVSRLCSVAALLRSHAGHAGDVCGTLAAYLTARFDQSAADDVSGNAVTLRQLKLADACDVGRSDLRIGEFYAVVSRAFDLRDSVAPSADRLAEIVGAHPEVGRSGFQIAPCFQKYERVVNRGVKEFSGHVYNLETGRNWFTVNGLIVHNCRCIAKPKLNFGNKNAS